MTEEFFGQWHIKIVAAPYPGLPISPMKLDITGSDNADDSLIQGDWPRTVDVTGARWTLDVFLANDTPPIWRPVRLDRSTEFTRSFGLVATITHHSRPMFICTFRDEQISPPPEPNPYDFTIPERG